MMMEVVRTPIDDAMTAYSIVGNYYLFDATSASIFAISEPAYRSVIGAESNDSTVSEQLSALEDRGFFNTSFNDWKSEEIDVSRRITEITFGITNNCNFNCNYCFGKNYLGKAEDEKLTLRVGKRSLDILHRNMLLHKQRQDERQGEYSLVFFGGEPLIRFGMIKQLVRYGRDLFKNDPKRLGFGITTNASLLNQETIDFFKENDVTPLISIDGGEAINDSYRRFRNGKGTYKKVAANLALAAKNHLAMGSRLTITKTCPEIDAVLLSVSGMGFFSNKMSIVSGPDTIAIQGENQVRLLESYARLAQQFVQRVKAGSHLSFDTFNHYLKILLTKQLYKVGCGIGLNGLSVSPSGTVHSCYKLLGEEETAMGNIFDDKIFAIKPGIDYAKQVDTIKRCAGCEIRNICGGGCFADSYMSSKFDQHLALDNRCEVERHKFMGCIWILSQFDQEDMDKLYRYLGL